VLLTTQEEEKTLAFLGDFFLVQYVARQDEIIDSTDLTTFFAYGSAAIIVFTNLLWPPEGNEARD
jgi:hypothetical protein